MGRRTSSGASAESTAVASAAALLIARALGVDDVNTVTAIAIVIGFIPALVTWIVVLARKHEDAP
jgi:hypothetical protein